MDLGKPCSTGTSTERSRGWGGANKQVLVGPFPIPSLEAGTERGETYKLSKTGASSEKANLLFFCIERKKKSKNIYLPGFKENIVYIK